MKKMRHCWYCGAEMGEIEDRHYERSDTCGKRECDRAARDAYQEERHEPHAMAPALPPERNPYLKAAGRRLTMEGGK